MSEYLNEQQQEAVTTINGPLLIIAGAGSGKTRVITHRIAHMINEGVSPFNILAITFTNKAAKEMKSRINVLCEKDAQSIQISTFHSFGAKMLRRQIHLIGYDRSFTIIDSNDQLVIVKQILKEKNIDVKKFNPRHILSKISRLKNDGVTIDEFESFVFTPYDELVRDVFREYSKRLMESNCVDFDDLLILPIRILKEHEDVLEFYQGRYKYILVDEYQDTNSLQSELITLLSKVHNNICVVGDEDQSIYSWRGANVQNILNFDKDYKDVKVVKLEENYRSTKNILDAANNLIKNNSIRNDKKLYTSNEEGREIDFCVASNEKEEVSTVLNQIGNLITQGETLNDIAILYRTNAQSRIFEEYLLREGIAYNIVGSYYFYSRKEIKDILAYLRLIVNCNDDISFRRVINEPKRGIGDKTLATLRDIAYGNELSFFKAIDLNLMSDKLNAKFKEFQEMIEDFKEYSKIHSLTNLIKYVIEKTGYKKMYEDSSVESSVKREYLDEFLSVSEAFTTNHEDITLEEFLEEISLFADMKQYNELDQKLTLMTVHAAKGLEFNNVFIVGLEEGIFPHSNSCDSVEELEEERRLCYVAITRAKKRLFISYAKSRLFLGSSTYNMKSRFLNELSFVESQPSSFEKVKYDEESSVEFKVGQKVKHKNYGEGIIVNVEDEVYIVAFGHDYGIKKISAFYNSLQSIG